MVARREFSSKTRKQTFIYFRFKTSPKSQQFRFCIFSVTEQMGRRRAGSGFGVEAGAGLGHAIAPPWDMDPGLGRPWAGFGHEP